MLGHLEGIWYERQDKILLQGSSEGIETQLSIGKTGLEQVLCGWMLEGLSNRSLFATHILTYVSGFRTFVISCMEINMILSYCLVT